MLNQVDFRIGSKSRSILYTTPFHGSANYFTLIRKEHHKPRHLPLCCMQKFRTKLEINALDAPEPPTWSTLVARFMPTGRQIVFLTKSPNLLAILHARASISAAQGAASTLLPLVLQPSGALSVMCLQQASGTRPSRQTPSNLDAG